jgi:hypothetical protein
MKDWKQFPPVDPELPGAAFTFDPKQLSAWVMENDDIGMFTLA